MVQYRVQSDASVYISSLLYLRLVKLRHQLRDVICDSLVFRESTRDEKEPFERVGYRKEYILETVKENELANLLALPRETLTYAIQSSA